MPIVIALLFVLAGLLPDTAQADPYRWCARYTLPGGPSNCYFMTLEQCRAAVSGVGGYCGPNPFYTGPDAVPRRAGRRSS
jgi:hypothetical protein